MTAPHPPAADLRGPLGHVGAIAGLLANTVLVASAATVTLIATAQRAIPSSAAPTTTVAIEGAAP